MTATAAALARLDVILAQVTLPGYRFEAGHEADYLFVRIVCDDGVCNVTGAPLPWNGRKWRLSQHMTDGEVVQTCFMAAKSAQEHELRERFTFQGAAVFGPHFDIYRLVELASDPTAIKEREHHGPTQSPSPPDRRGAEPPAVAASGPAIVGAGARTGGEGRATLARLGQDGDGAARRTVGRFDGGAVTYVIQSGPGGVAQASDEVLARRYRLEDARRQGRTEAAQAESLVSR